MTEQYLDSNIPGNPAYPFTVVPPGTEPVAGWACRADLLSEAGFSTQCIHAGFRPTPPSAP